MSSPTGGRRMESWRAPKRKPTRLCQSAYIALTFVFGAYLIGDLSQSGKRNGLHATLVSCDLGRSGGLGGADSQEWPFSKM